MTNFFITMRNVESSLEKISNRDKYPDKIRKEFRKLVLFVESGCFVDTVSYKFICRNWRLTSVKLADEWVREGNKVKSPNTFRAQVFHLSNILKGIFLVDSVEDVYLVQDSEAVERVSRNIDALTVYADYNDCTFDKLFLKEVSDYIGNVVVEEEDYSPSECNLELSMLKSLMSGSVDAVLDETDVTKLAYLRQIMNKPVVLHGNKVNDAKIICLSALNLIKAVPLGKLSGSIYSDENTQDSYSDIKSGSITESTDSFSDIGVCEKYGLVTLDVLFSKLEQRAKEDSLPTEQNYKKALKMVSLLLSKETCDKVINELSPDDVKEFLGMFNNHKS